MVCCLEDENELPLNVIASFSAWYFALPFIPVIVLHSLIRCLLTMVSTKSLIFFRFCTHMRFSMSLFSLGSSCEVGSFLRRASRLVITSGSSCLVITSRISAGRIVRKVVYLFGSMLEGKTCSGRPPRLVCIYLN